MGILSLARALLNYSNINTRKERWLHQLKKLRRIKFSKYLHCRISDNKNRDSTEDMPLDGEGGRLTNQKILLFQRHGHSCGESVTVRDGEQMC